MMNPTLRSWILGWKGLLLAYLLLLGASHALMALQSDKADGVGVGQSLELAVTEGDSLTSRTVRFSYQDRYRGSRPDPTTLLLLSAGERVRPLAEGLSDSLRVIQLGGPAQDPSADSLPDYSMQSRARYASQLLDSLGVENVHVLGHNRGGAAAIHFAHDDSARTASLTLLSAIGVQELRLLGSHPINRAVYGFQLGVTWMARNLTPHFGSLGSQLTLSHVRGNFDTDQRPLRGYLEGYSKPMLIQHGQDDAVVPSVVAKEHARIVPQSVLELYSGDHSLAADRSAELASRITVFVGEVEAGKALTRAGAPQHRLEEAARSFENIDFARFEGLSLAILMFIIAISTFVSEDLTCIGAGLLAARGLLGFLPATAACFLGIFIGDMGLYLIGRFLGRPALKKAPLKWMISEADLKRSSEWFAAKGPAIIIASRFLPGSRLPTYLSAGMVGAGFWMFTFYFLVAAVAWTPILVGLSMLVGSELIAWFSVYSNYAIWVILGTLLFLVVFVKGVMPAFSYRGRRLLVSRWRRITRWEFWPVWVLYAPVCLYIGWLSLRYRSLTLFTAANPGMPEGGFVGESKSDILELMGRQPFLPPWTLIAADLPPGNRILEAREFLNREEMTFPVVLKPDRGQRGQGVHIVHSRERLEELLSDAGCDLILQGYVEGEEYGVFYYRMPGEQTGHIFSITCKSLLYLKGDGASTIEELILEDDRAVSLAKRHLQAQRNRLYEIPAEDERVSLVEIGTHARGARFRDGAEYITDDLRRAMDRISGSLKGFAFGRYDLKAPSPEALKRGEGLKVIEVNGVTSESTNIYDPSNSFLDAQRILMRQWKLAFETGRRQAERGHEPASPWKLLRRIAAFLTGRN
ncbi:MAG: VTT domain-containing protein [Balneolaceae bacterium]|nr:VTT domain-containing protein [Balneolaceae bacterium]